MLKSVKLLQNHVQEIGIAANQSAVAATEQVKQLAGCRRSVAQFSASSTSQEESLPDDLPVEVRAVLKQLFECVDASAIGKLA
jgi:hypothetical protein